MDGQGKCNPYSQVPFFIIQHLFKEGNGHVKFKAKNIFIVIFIIALVSGNIYQASELTNLSSKYTALKDENKDYKSKNKDLKDKNTSLAAQVEVLNDDVKRYKNDSVKYQSYADEYNFYENSACVVSAVAGSKYHRYSCQYVDNFTEIYILNVEYAEYLGYEPCSVCNPPEPEN